MKTEVQCPLEWGNVQAGVHYKCSLPIDHAGSCFDADQHQIMRNWPVGEPIPIRLPLPGTRPAEHPDLDWPSLMLTTIGKSLWQRIRSHASDPYVICFLLGGFVGFTWGVIISN